MPAPQELRYSEDHEWAKAEPGGVRVGITDFAQEALGDVVFVGLPELGSVVEATAEIGEIESTKSVSELYAPIAGEVVEVNELLHESPELLNSDPYGKGWICVLRPRDPGDLDRLLSADQYQELTVT